MGLASGKTKLKLIDIGSGSDRGKPRDGDTRPFAFQKPTSADLPLDFQDLDGATEIGASLRDARERSGQNLRDISRHLKIRHEYLRAIEDGDFKSLPGMTYAIGYVRSYAQYLDLDVENAITLFKSEAQDIDGPRQLIFPSPAPEGKVPGGAVMFVAAFLAVFAYAGWYYVSDSGRSVAGYTLAIPESLQSWLDEKADGTGSSDGFTSTAVASIPAPAIDAPITSEPVNSTSEEATPSVSAAPSSSEKVPRNDVVPSNIVMASSTAAPETTTTDAGMLATEISAPLETAIAPTGEADPAVSQITAATLPIFAQEPTPQASPEPTREASSVEETPKPTLATTTVALADIPKAPLVNSAVDASTDEVASQARVQPATTTSPVSDRTRIVIQATAPSWVQVRAADSTTVMTRVMRAGDVYEVPDRDGLRLFTGNAGALTILVDGKEIPKLGGSGQIARNIDLEPANLRQRFN
ncbi:MAG: DUF4115 domain-containing protein [Alphaproteobacteria bacterium]|nr:DUF4115 domain-containing protein [Alphaproteobacteria bacterium]